jgi:ubiquinone/menaquinone biosynthesis C-methylase UbiE
VKLAGLERTFGRKLNRVATNAVTARPGLWRLFRAPLRLVFDRIAATWDQGRSPTAFEALKQALAALPVAPRRVLDLGTGTGTAALLAAERFPNAEVVGADISEQMLAQAREKTPPELAARVRFEAADGSRLPFEDGAFDLAVLSNMIPFYDELARVTAPGGHVLLSFSAGPETPIWVPLERITAELEQRGFADFAHFRPEPSVALLARKGPAV